MINASNLTFGKDNPRRRKHEAEDTIIEFIRHAGWVAADITPRENDNLRGILTTYHNNLTRLGLTASIGAREQGGRLYLYRKGAAARDDGRDKTEQSSLFDR